MDRITTNGLNMPRLGLGTWPMKGAECVAAVQGALGLGYRHLDTAEMYGNEAEVGEALAGSGLPRGEVHVTTKVWWDHLAPDAMRRAIEDSLHKLRTEYVDLYLIHWPAPDMDLPGALETLARLKEEGRARAVGVSNFPSALLSQAVDASPVPLACVQVEYHPLLSQKPVLDVARANGLALTAYSPVAKNKVAEQPELRRIAAKHGASPAQISLAWLLSQDGVVAIPKAQSEANQRANLEAASLRLDEEDLAAIAALPKNQRQVNPSFAPAWDKAA